MDSEATVSMQTPPQYWWWLKKAVVLECPAWLSISSVEWTISSPQSLLAFIHPCGWAYVDHADFRNFLRLMACLLHVSYQVSLWDRIFHSCQRRFLYKVSASSLWMLETHASKKLDTSWQPFMLPILFSVFRTQTFRKSFCWTFRTY